MSDPAKPENSGLTRTQGEPLRVLHWVASSEFGGAERVVIDLVRRARARGEPVRLAAPKGTRCEQGLSRALDLPVEGVAVPDPDRLRARDWRKVALDGLRRSRSADVVHAHLPWPDRLGAALIARGRRPAVVSFQLLPEHPILDLEDIAFGRLGVRGPLRAARAIAPLCLVALTHTDQERLRASFPGAQIARIPNVAPAPIGEPPPALPPGRGVRLLAVGQLSERKGFARLLRALTEPARRHDFTLYIAGQGDERAALDTLAGELGLSDRVHFLGQVSAYQLYPEVDLFVTLSSAEGMPLALLEAMTAGVAVLASPIPSHRELLEGIEGALLASEPASWPATLEKLIADEPLRRQIGAAARERARTQYSAEAQDRAYQAVYAQVLRA